MPISPTLSAIGKRYSTVTEANLFPPITSVSSRSANSSIVVETVDHAVAVDVVTRAREAAAISVALAVERKATHRDEEGALGL
jgi:hypothetical protein